MAFKDQVEDLTSLTVTDNDELSQFLKDGVIDVTNKWLAVRPQDSHLFTRESAEQTSNTSSPLNLNGAKIISVIRENGTNNYWRNCRKISPAEQYNVEDEESLSYASKINPAYMIGDNGNISVFPAPSSTTDAFKVYYVNNDPEEDDGTDLEYNSASIKYFSDDKVYLVIIYAGMKLLQATMGAKTITDLGVTAVPPDSPTLSLGSEITFPTSSIPTYDNTIASSEFTNLSTFIDTEEDIELAGAKIQEINAILQNELNEFNEKNTKFQSKLQEAIKNADFDNEEDARLVQKYQAEVAAYQADIQRDVQEFQSNVQADVTEYQWLQSQYTSLKNEYDAAFALNRPPQAPSQPERRRR